MGRGRAGGDAGEQRVELLGFAAGAQIGLVL